jgi:ribosomal protein S18 acetylase RimI-like enzyme
VVIICRPYEASDGPSLMDLWTACRLISPQNDPDRDVRRKLARDAENLLVLEVDGELIGSVMVGYEGHRGWINYLGVHPNHEGRGYGRRLMSEAESRLRDLGCPKVNLQVRAENSGVIGFYRSLGYEVDDVVSMGRRLEEDR